MFNISETEKKILDFWEENKIFEKSLIKDAPNGDYSFYDGPPFATGLPHYGHIVASIMKDIIPRYKTMRGYRVERKWGWDCHGLPIENIAEKELGSKNKKDIEAMGVEKFNEICRSKVLEYVEGWKVVIKKLGRWVDMENDYKTMDLNYMESVWWVFKELWDKGLIYEGYRSMHICPRCETTLSQMEVSEGYKIIKDLSVIAKFELIEEPGTFVLAWTTTPWTLIANVALAVNPEMNYVKVKTLNVAKRANEGSTEYENLIIAEDIFEKLYSLDDKNPLKLAFNLSYANKIKEGEDAVQGAKIVATYKGAELVGKEYNPVFDYYFNDDNLPNKENGWKIYAGDFVTMSEGTGIVHIAPGFGENDLEMSRKYNLPFIQHVGMDGVIKEEAKDFMGLNVKPIDDYQKTDIEIIKYLAGQGLLFGKEKYEHSYSHCWRCDTPLINYATSSWFVNILKIKADALEFAKEINWFPPHIKEGRFGKWLEGARDWSISRQRFWASVMPIWKCKCGEMKVFGSVADLEKISGQKITDIHKHIVDKIKFPCEKCAHSTSSGQGGEMTRIPDVLDTWFDSGLMPYAQMHYPFENKEKFENNFPAEFIAEGVDQTRAWFYYLHIIGTAIKDSHAFKNVIVNGIVLAEDGKKMSKKLKNYPDPSLILEKYGADALRFYLMSSPVVSAENLNFSEKGVEEALRKNVMTLWNVYKFYELFNDDAKDLKSPDDIYEISENILDKWILIRLNDLVFKITKNMDGYDLSGAARPITDFIDDLSTWYLRRSRERFKSDNQQEKDAALLTTHYVLVELSKLIAPFMPFVAEDIWQGMTGNNFQNNKKSVHLEEWPDVFIRVDKSQENNNILEKMNMARKVVELSLSARKNANIKTRQVLILLTVKCSANIFQLLSNDSGVIDLIRDELNVKEVKFVKHDGNLDVELDTAITRELEIEGLSREIIRTVNAIRKEVGLSVNDSAQLYYSSDELNEIFDRFGKYILRETICEEYILGSIDKADMVKEIVVDGNKILIGIKIL